jgi:hypothetical protein
MKKAANFIDFTTAKITFARTSRWYDKKAPAPLPLGLLYHRFILDLAHGRFFSQQGR